MQPHNYMEEVVSDILEEVKNDINKDYQYCICEQCKADVKALALNNLPNKYVVDSEDKIKAKIISWETQEKTRILREIVKAFGVVDKNPRH